MFCFFSSIYLELRKSLLDAANHVTMTLAATSRILLVIVLGTFVTEFATIFAIHPDRKFVTSALILQTNNFARHPSVLAAGRRSFILQDTYS